MRALLKITLFLAGAGALILAAGFYWLYFYSRDLPDISMLSQYAPATVTQVSDPCFGPSTAIPYEAIGTNVRDAISAVETSEDDPGVLPTTVKVLASGEPPRKKTRIASLYISRMMCYAPSGQLKREFAEMRTAVQMERRYSRRQLFTVYANCVPIGPSLIGVHDGAGFYFHKGPADLTASEAALLVGLIRSPSYYSPITHPDRALYRRNEVIDAMVENGELTVPEGQTAKSAPLGIVATASTRVAP